MYISKEEHPMIQDSVLKPKDEPSYANPVRSPCSSTSNHDFLHGKRILFIELRIRGTIHGDDRPTIPALQYAG